MFENIPTNSTRIDQRVVWRVGCDLCVFGVDACPHGGSSAKQFYVLNTFINIT